MLAYLILGIALLAGFLLVGRWYANADPKSILRALKWLLVGLVMAIALFFVFTGRIVWAIAAIPALLPWFFRFRQAARTARTFHRMNQAAGGGGPGGTSDVRTRYLDMSLDHASGRIAGTVREGPFAGRNLDSLSLDELRALRTSCADDAESQRLLETYLDRDHPAWRETSQEHDTGHETGHGSRNGNMSRSEALAILGLEEGADTAAVHAAHRRLIANLHPDKGGSSYLAAQINRAKDVLLG